jgi:hypothetical protein
MEKSLPRRISNRVFAKLARVAPGGSSLRPFLHRLRGVNIEGRVFIGEDVYLENEYPERIELHDGAQINIRSILLAHTHGTGRIVIGKDAFVGANCVIAAPPGATLTIGEGAVVTTSSVITSDVPPHTLIGNEKARPLGTATIALTMNTSYERFLAGLRPLSREHRATTTAGEEQPQPGALDDVPKSQ